MQQALSVMPRQKVSDKEKDEKWRKDCVRACQSLVLLNNQYTRNARTNKIVNYDLYAGILHPSDIKMIMNPTNLKDVTFPAQVRNHPLINPYIKILIGEELKRRFDFNLKVENEDAISEKEVAKKNEIQKVLQELLLQGLQQPQIDPNDPQAQQKQDAYDQEVTKRLTGLNKYINYEWQDIRELAGTRLLTYYRDKNKLNESFMRGWEDALISSEELYHIDIVNNEPKVTRCNPLNTYFLLPPDSYKVEDANTIVEEKYVPVSHVIDAYYNYLTPEEIDYLESRTEHRGVKGYGQVPNYELQDPMFSFSLGSQTGINVSALQNTFNASFAPFDTNNNVRTCKVKWMSMRRVGVITSFNPDTMEEEKTIVHDAEKPNKLKGEKIEYLWINEWWEGTQIADNIFVKMEPCELQYRQLNNISECKSGYVGSVYKTNSSVPQSLVDIIKPYQYAYILYMYRTELAFIKAKGRIGKLDLSKIPDGWEVDKWMYYAETMGWAVEDSFKEAKKGAATGKFAGQFQGSGGDVLNLELGNYIQQHIQMLGYIEGQIDKITGINQSRRGAISSEQGLGVTQEAKLASANITEWYFRIHDSTKTRVYEHLLEASKCCLRNGNKTIQYITDEMTSEIFKIDGELINEAEFGLIVRNATEDQASLDMLRRASESALQSGQVDIIQLMDIYSNQSLSSIKRKIEKSVNEKIERASKEKQDALASNQQMNDANLAQAEKQHLELLDLEHQKLDLAKYKIDVENETKITVSQMTSLAMDEGPNTEDINIASRQALAERELEQSIFAKSQEHYHKQSVQAAKNTLEQKKLSIEEKRLKQQVDLEKMKADNKIAVEKLKLKNKVVGEK